MNFRSRSEGPPVDSGGPSLFLACLIGLGLPLTIAYKTGPPAGHTGGFGEPTCHTCHGDYDANEPGGSLAVMGFPPTYIAGTTYDISVRVRSADLGRAGFQLAIRFAEGELQGKNAGSLVTTDARTGVITAEKTGVQYAQHVIAGVEPLWTDSTEWTLRWTAPQSGGSVLLHIAANASNYDESEYGDHIYFDSLSSTPAARDLPINGLPLPPPLPRRARSIP